MGNLFSKKSAETPRPVAMPDTESPAVKAAEETRRRQIAARSGRTSTIMSRQNEPGGAYKNSLLGQAG